MSEALTAPDSSAPVLPRCRIEEVFDPNFIELIRLVPLNPYVRALILRQAGKMPPLECGTFEVIKEWLETSCDLSSRSRPHRMAASAEEGGISINVEFSETEYGRANYEVSRSGNDEFRLTAGELMVVIREVIESSGGMEEVIEAIAATIEDDAWSQCDPSLDHYGDYDYSEHESSDSADSQTAFSRSEIRNAVQTFLRQHRPELAEEL